jgi:lysine 2,3-aminomutase
MSNMNERNFGEKITEYLREYMSEVRESFGESSPEYTALKLQFCEDPREKNIDLSSERRRHYEAEINLDYEGKPLKGVERLYRRVVLIEPTTYCTAYCRWCLRAKYPDMALSKDEIMRAVRYAGDKVNRDDVRELLVTGGDPLVDAETLDFTLDAIREYAPNVETVRIGSRLLVHDPERVNDELLEVLRPHDNMRIELGTQINHAIELSEKTRNAIKLIQSQNIRIYAQNVLLQGVNDTAEALYDLYDSLRSLHVESHYLFHCIPMRGMSHHRTTLDEGLVLIRQLVMSGKISGRAKPAYAAMTDVGKVTLYDGVVLNRKGNMVLLQTEYSAEERRIWNPSWELPDSAREDQDGRIQVWYQDAKKHNEGWPTTCIIEG